MRLLGGDPISVRKCTQAKHHNHLFQPPSTEGHTGPTPDNEAAVMDIKSRGGTRQKYEDRGDKRETHPLILLVPSSSHDHIFKFQLSMRALVIVPPHSATTCTICPFHPNTSCSCYIVECTSHPSHVLKEQWGRLPGGVGEGASIPIGAVTTAI